MGVPASRSRGVLGEAGGVGVGGGTSPVRRQRAGEALGRRHRGEVLSVFSLAALPLARRTRGGEMSMTGGLPCAVS